MNPISDERFDELAHKAVAGNCTPEESAELQHAVAESPDRADKLAQLHALAAVAKDLLALARATEATTPALPEHIRVRLQEKLAAAKERKRRAAAGTADPPIIEATVISDRSFNLYKILFFLLIAIGLIVGAIYFLKNYSLQRKGAPPNPEQKASPGPAATNAVKSAETEVPSTPSIQTPAKSAKAVTGKLPGYRGAQWKAVYTGNSRPGVKMGFDEILSWDGSHLSVRGAVAGRAGGVPQDLMFLTGDSGKWKTRDFQLYAPGIRFAAEFAMDRFIVSDPVNTGKLYRIDKAAMTALPVPAQSFCRAVHQTEDGTLFLHLWGPHVFKVTGSSVTLLKQNDPANFVNEHGEPTALMRSSIGLIAKADTGETMGLYRLPNGNGQLVVTRFNGSLWESVCPLGDNSEQVFVHYLSKDSLVAAVGRNIMGVKEGLPQEISLPSGMRSDSAPVTRAIRAASTEEFLLVDNFGGVHKYANGDFTDELEPLDAIVLEGGRGGGLRSVQIAPKGVIYGIYHPSTGGVDTLYRLDPTVAGSK